MRTGDESRLRAALRLQTQALHAQVERSGVMQALLRGRLDRTAYSALLRNLHAVYGPLEAALARHAAHPRLAPLALPGLAREQALADDLAVLHGACWQGELAVHAAAQAYARRLRELDATAPGLLLAHAYVRYLGDLSGGQILRRIVAGQLGIEGADGVHFYDFGNPDGASALARRFRAGLDAVPIDDAGIAEQVAEAQWSFTLHGRLFEEIQAAGAHAVPDA